MGTAMFTEVFEPNYRKPPSKHRQKRSHREKVRKIMRHLLGSALFICWSGITKENDIRGSRHSDYFPANNFNLLFPQNLPITLISQNSIVDPAPGEKCTSSTGRTQKPIFVWSTQLSLNSVLSRQTRWLSDMAVTLVTEILFFLNLEKL